MNPPYESLYKKGAGFGDSVLGLKRFYRRVGLLPDETVSDSADYLCVELDFMRQLCLREESLRRRKRMRKPSHKSLHSRRSFLGYTWETGSGSSAAR